MTHRVQTAPQESQVSRQSSWLASWWPPVVAWLGATTVVLLTAARAGWPPFDPVRTWERQDAFLYLSVAKSGYNLVRCSQLHPPIAGTWCGNAGWFPAYPWIVGGLHDLGLPLAATALAVSWLAGFGTLIVLWREFLAGSPALAAGIALVYAALAPGLVYNYADFPLSLTTFCTVTCFALLRRRRWALAGLAAAVAALAYPVGLAVASAGVLWVLTDRATGLGERLRRAVLLAVPALIGLAGFALDQRLSTGRWDAYLLVQQKYGHHLQDPLEVLATAFRTFAHSRLVARPSLSALNQLASATSLQTLLIAFVVACCLITLAVRRGADGQRDDVLIAIWVVLAWLALYLSSQVHTYRGEVAMLPVAVLVRRLPWPLATVVTAAALLLVAPMTRLYLADVLR